MSNVTKEQVENALKQYIDPYLEKDLVAAGCIKNVAIDGDKVTVDVTLGFPAKGYTAELAAALRPRSSPWRAWAA